MKNRKTSIALVLMLNASVAWSAEEPGSPLRGERAIDDTPVSSGCASMFQILDADRDGYVDKSEAKKSAETMATWKNLDGDRDERLSKEELCGVPTRTPARLN